MKRLTAQIVFLYLGLVTSASASNAFDWRQRQEIWWTKPPLIKNAIVSFFDFRSGVGEGSKYDEASFAIVELLLLLDRDSDRKTVNVLADLSSYNLGTAGSEIYECLLERKGSMMVAALRARENIKEDDCVKTLGARHPVCIASRGLAARRQRLHDLISLVRSNQPCAIEK